MDVDAMARAAEGELDAMVDQAFAVRAPAGADLVEQRHRSFFKQAGADAAEHIIRRLAFQNDVVDSIGVKQLPQQQSRWPRTDDCYFCPQCLLLWVGLDCKAAPEGNACGGLAIIIISYNKFRNGHGNQTTCAIALHRKNIARLIFRTPAPDVRLEKSGKLDNMLINKIGYRKPALTSKGREMSMRKAILALLLAASVTPALAQDKTVNMKVSLWVPPAHPLVPATQAWAADIEKASGGTIKISVFPSEQLGKAFDHYDMARDGIADITYVNPGYQPGRFPIIAIGQMPFMFGDARKGTAALDSWYRKYAATEMKDTHFCFAFIHDPGALHSRKKIVLPQDLRGAKVRPAQSTIAELVTKLGGTNVQASAPEAREVLERGVADAITFPWGSLYLFGIDKVVKHHIDAPLYTTVFTFSMNKDKYESMSPAQKKVMDDHCTTDWAVKIAGPWGDFEAAGRDKMRADPTHELIKLTPDQMQAWRATVEPLKASWAAAVKQAGADPDAALTELNASIAKYGAGP